MTVTHVNTFAFLVWNMELNVKYSLRYSKTGMIHDNYMKLKEFNYTGWDQ